LGGAFAGLALWATPLMAQEEPPAPPDITTAVEPGAIKAKIEALIPELEAYVEAGLGKAGAPGAALGIVHGDKLVYARGFGLREAGKPDKVTPQTLFQIGATTKAYLSAALAQAVDAGKLAWSDRVVDHFPEFHLSDPWIERDFRLLDL